MGFAVKIQGDSAAIDPGSTMTLAVEVENLAETGQEFEIRVEGLDSQWLATPVATFWVEPGRTATERVIVRPARESESRAGTYPYAVVVRSLASGESRSCPAVLEVRQFHNLALEINPRRATLGAFRREASLHLKLLNLGNAPQTVQLFAADSDSLFAFEFEADQVTVQPGQERVVAFSTAAAKSSIVASSRLQNYTVSARSVENPAVGATATGQIELRALLAPASLFFLMFLIALTVAYMASWPPTPSVDGVTISPERVTVGEPVTVRWNTSGTKWVSLRIGNWTKTRQAPGGSIEFTPDVPGEFPVMVTAYSGRRTAVDQSKRLTVVAKSVLPEPKVRVWLDSETVAAGQSYILRYECNDAVTKATLFPMQRELDVRGNGIELQASTPGRLDLKVIASNADGVSTEAQVALTVVERPDAAIVKFDVAPKELPEGGGEVTVEWTVTGASRIEILYGGQRSLQESATGTFTATVATDTAFRMVAYDAKGRTVTSDTIRVKVAKPPKPPVGDEPLPDTGATAGGR